MSEDEAKKPAAAEPAASELARHRQDQKRARLAAALRANLQKRKQQARLRESEE